MPSRLPGRLFLHIHILFSFRHPVCKTRPICCIIILCLNNNNNNNNNDNNNNIYYRPMMSYIKEAGMVPL